MQGGANDDIMEEYIKSENIVLPTDNTAIEHTLLFEEWLNRTSPIIFPANIYDSNIHRFNTFTKSFEVVDRKYIKDELDIISGKIYSESPQAQFGRYNLKPLHIQTQPGTVYRYDHAKYYTDSIKYNAFGEVKEDSDVKQYHNMVGKNIIQVPALNIRNTYEEQCHFIAVLNMLASCDLLVAMVTKTVLTNDFHIIDQYYRLGRYINNGGEYKALEQTIPSIPYVTQQELQLYRPMYDNVKPSLYETAKQLYIEDLQSHTTTLQSRPPPLFLPKLLFSNKSTSNSIITYDINDIFKTDKFVLKELLRIFYYSREFVIDKYNKNRIHICDLDKIDAVLALYGAGKAAEIRRPTQYLSIVMKVLRRYPSIIGFANAPNGFPRYTDTEYSIQRLISMHRPIYMFIDVYNTAMELHRGIPQNELIDYNSVKYDMTYRFTNLIKEFTCNGSTYELVAQTVSCINNVHTGVIFSIGTFDTKKEFNYNDPDTFDVTFLLDSNDSWGGRHGAIYYPYCTYIDQSVEGSRSFKPQYGTSLALFVRKDNNPPTEEPLKITKWFNLKAITKEHKDKYDIPKFQRKVHLKLLDGKVVLSDSKSPNIIPEISDIGNEHDFMHGANPIIGRQRYFLGGHQ